MTDNAELLPCPFCGDSPNPDPQNDDCPLPGDYGKDGSRYYQTIWCEKCGAEGGKRKSGREAIAAWNTRAPVPASAAGAGEECPMCEVWKATAASEAEAFEDAQSRNREIAAALSTRPRVSREAIIEALRPLNPTRQLRAGDAIDLTEIGDAYLAKLAAAILALGGGE